ncbi:MAG: hypothetical protein MUD07_07785 [Burkholderiaceae bacterium]|nr:hypothetical protein [Burkholderiaceae bacterium]
MKRITTFALLLLTLPALAQTAGFGERFPAGSIGTRSQADAAIAAANAEEARLAREFDARDAECLTRFLVNDCKEKVRRERELALRDVRRVELEARDTRRRLDQEDLARRRAEQAQAEAAEAQARRDREAASAASQRERQQKAAGATGQGAAGSRRARAQRRGVPAQAGRSRQARRGQCGRAQASRGKARGTQAGAGTERGRARGDPQAGGGCRCRAAALKQPEATNAS